MEKELYRVSPLQKKNIFNRIELYRENEDGSESWFVIEECYRWGFGFYDSKGYLPTDPNTHTYTESQIGWGPELDDRINCSIQFSDNISSEEKEEIENNLCYGDNEELSGSSWLYEGEHNWIIQEDSIIILPPYQIDKVDPEEYGKLLEENVKIE